MKFLEKNLEDIVFNTPINKIYDRGLKTIGLFGLRKRQLKIGNYGVADIATFSRCSLMDENNYLNITVFELKRDLINIDALLQAVRYLKGIDRYIFYKRKKEIDVRYNIVLIGEKLDLDTSFVYLPDFLSKSDFEVKMFTYQYDFDGIRFQEHKGFCLTNEGF